MDTFFDKTKIVIKDDFDKLKNSNIALLGVGGVGGYVFEMLVRLGVKKITVVDFDKFEITNLNRQLLATTLSVGKNKVDEAVCRASIINNDCKVKAINKKISKENICEILNDNFDYVIDAIDDVNAKIEIIKYCDEKHLPLICSMGTGNRSKIPNFIVDDLFKTSYDGLARKIRNQLKKIGFNKKVMVVYTKEQAQEKKALGSVVYYPLVCAGVITSFVVNEIIKNKI